MDLTLSPAALNTGAVLFGEYQHNHLLFIIINFQSYIFGEVVSLLLWSPQRQPKHRATAALFCCGRHDMLCCAFGVVVMCWQKDSGCCVKLWNKLKNIFEYTIRKHIITPYVLSLWENSVLKLGSGVHRK